MENRSTIELKDTDFLAAVTLGCQALPVALPLKYLLKCQSDSGILWLERRQAWTQANG